MIDILSHSPRTISFRCLQGEGKADEAEGKSGIKLVSSQPTLAGVHVTTSMRENPDIGLGHDTATAILDKHQFEDYSPFQFSLMSHQESSTQLFTASILSSAAAATA